MNMLVAYALLALLTPCFVGANADSPRPSGPSDKPRVADDVYPPQRKPSVLHFFTLEGDLKGEPLRKALSELSTATSECRIAYGPLTTASRPSRNVIAIEAPAAVAVKDIVRALAKGAKSAEELAWTRYDDKPAQQISMQIAGLTVLDLVIGMASDMRWFDEQGGTLQFFFTGEKLTPHEIEDKYSKLFKPLGGGNVGKLALETFSWLLATPRDPAAVQRAEKSIGRLRGVRQATIDFDEHVLHVTVELANLKVSGVRAGQPTAKPATAAEADATPQRAPRACFDTNPILDLLEKEGLTLAAPATDKGGR